MKMYRELAKFLIRESNYLTLSIEFNFELL
jgi:hypothetical protein